MRECEATNYPISKLAMFHLRPDVFRIHTGIQKSRLYEAPTYHFFFPMTQPDPPEKPSEAPRSAKPRINTQIHRRQKAKAVPPMEDEWDDQSETPPNLRTPSSKMKKP